MRILLLRDVPGLGKKNELKTVPDGYGRNFLIPRGLAKVATAEVAAAAQAQLALEKKRQDELLQKYHEEAARLHGTTISLPVKVGQKGEVWSPIRAKEIQHALSEKGFKDAQVTLERPLKQLGTHSALVEFGQGVTASVTVLLIPA